MSVVVSVVTPSCKPPDDEVKAGIAALEAEGFEVRVGGLAFDARPHTVDEDKRRARELQAALTDPASAAVLCARGGYGVARLLDYLDLDAIARCETPFCGYSDITTLHGILARYAPRMPRAYGPMAASSMVANRTERSRQLFRFLRREPLGNILETAPPEELTVLRGGVARGPIAGGCLCLVVATLGTPYEIETRGKILLLEDVNEESRRVDRYLTQLLHAGKLDDLRGVIAGRTFCLTDEEDPMATQEEILRRYFEPLGVPVLLDAPVGHVGDLLTVPLDIEAELDLSNPSGPTLTVECP